MDLNRSPDILCTSSGKDTPFEGLSDVADEQTYPSSEPGIVSDSEDDLFLGTDAQIFCKPETPLLSPGGLSKSTGCYFESSSDSTGCPANNREFRKLGHLRRTNSTDSCMSDLSDISRASHDVCSLLNAMTVDPEEFLTDLGFAEADLRTRIPNRFFESPSRAQGIDVDSFRRSLDQDDLCGSPSQESPVWSDPGSSRIPLRFISCDTDPINTVFSGPFSSVPLISEPEDAREESFDLMRHLRLNKPHHVTKGMYLEPVTEELEVSSVGSGTIRTRISRELSNEEGTLIVREESLEQANLEPDLALSVPVIESEQTGFDSNEPTETTVIEKVQDESLIVANANFDESASMSATEGTSPDEVLKSSSGVVDSNNYGKNNKHFTSITSDYNDKEYLSGEKAADEDERLTHVSSVPAVLAHLKVASIVVQDSFELEEIGNEDFSERESSSFTDQESGIIAKASEKRLIKENSGESSGFGEMLPEKEATSSNSCSPVMDVKEFPVVECNFASDARPLEPLLDPEMLSLAVEEKSPRATFAQRRTKSLTKQRPVEEDSFGSWISCSSFPLPKCVAGNLRTSVSQDYSIAVSEFQGKGPSFLSKSIDEPSVHVWNAQLHSCNGETDENCNRTSKVGLEELPVTVVSPALEKCDSSVGKYEKTSTDSFENEKQINGESWILENDSNTAIRQAALSSNLQSNATSGYDGNFSPSSVTSEDFFSRQSLGENSDDNFNAETRETNSHSEHESESSHDVTARGSLSISSPNEEVGACAEKQQRKESQKALRKVDSEFQQHYLHELNVLEKSIQKYELNLSSEGPLDRVRASDYTKHVLVRITEEMNAIQELRLMISSELDRMKFLLSERRRMLLAGVTESPVCFGVSQKMAELLREQSSLNTGLSNISDELSIRKKALRRARICAHIESAKKELKEDREKCMKEFLEEIKEGIARELSEKFSTEIELLRQEVRSKDAVIEQLLLKNHEQTEGLHLDNSKQS